MLVGGGGDDRVDLSSEGEAGGHFHAGTGDAAGAHSPRRAGAGRPGGIITQALVPLPHHDPAIRPDGRQLVFSPDRDDLGIQRRRERGGGDLRPDTAGIAQRDGQARHPAASGHRHIRIST